MPLRFRCPACGGTLQAPDAMAGQPGACHFCHARIIAPDVSGGTAALVSAGAQATPGTAGVPGSPGVPGVPGSPSGPGAAGVAGMPGFAMPAALDYAPFSKRVLGFIVDTVLLWVLSMLLRPIFDMLNPWQVDLQRILQGLTSVPVEGAAPGLDYALPSTVTMVLGVLVSLLWTSTLQWLYFALFESSSTQATPGKMLAGIKVTDAFGRRISFGRATWRTMAKGFSAMLCFIGYLMAAFNEKGQALHDILANTVVLNQP